MIQLTFGFLRERFLKFVCGLELTDTMASRTLQSMFTRNLGKAQMMTYIYSFNLPATEAIDFAYGANDILQWQVGSRLQFINFLIKCYVLGTRPQD